MPKIPEYRPATKSILIYSYIIITESRLKFTVKFYDEAVDPYCITDIMI